MILIHSPNAGDKIQWEEQPTLTIIPWEYSLVTSHCDVCYELLPKMTENRRACPGCRAWARHYIARLIEAKLEWFRRFAIDNDFVEVIL